MRRKILELIWSDAVVAMDPGRAVRMRRLLQAMIPVKFVFLENRAGVIHPAVMPDDLEVMPELSLGDVVVEELGVDVPFGSMLVIQDESHPGYEDRHAMSMDIGIVVGRVLLELLNRGGLPLERETEALYIMACAFDRMARSSGLRLAGLMPEEFSKGLVATLGAYWTGTRGSRTEQSGLFNCGTCLAGDELRAYLGMLDPHFAAPSYHRIPPALMVLSSGTYTLEDWMTQAASAVAAFSEAPRTQLVRG